MRAWKRVEGLKQLLLRPGKGAHTCSRDSREEACGKATRNVNERSVPFTSVAC